MSIEPQTLLLDPGETMPNNRLPVLIYRQTGSEDIQDYAGLGRRSPLAAACMGACLFSLIGLPPFAGFAAKFDASVTAWSTEHNPFFGGESADLLSLIPFVLIVLALYLAGRDKAPQPA